MDVMMPSLLDSRSMMNFMWQNYFNQYFRPQPGSLVGLEAEAHSMFDLKSASSGAVKLPRYIELDAEFHAENFIGWDFKYPKSQ